MIEIKNFSKIYNGENKAVDNINLTVNSGEIFAQTISDYSLLVVYETQRIVYDEVIYSGCILSGAAIK